MVRRSGVEKTSYEFNLVAVLSNNANVLVSNPRVLYNEYLLLLLDFFTIFRRLLYGKLETWIQSQLTQFQKSLGKGQAIASTKS